jgi:pSer/pThr/pTyr-binding forkhead associated (FHA) protein
VIRLTAVIEVEGHAPRALTCESNARTIVLGRDASADFQLPLATISRHHARISETDNVYVIEDLGSTHGTLLNGKKIDSGQKKVLRNGDIIELTRAKITCAIESEKVASAEPGEGTQAIAARAVQGILGRLGEAKSEGPFLRVLAGPDENARYPLAGALAEWTLGRSKDCECVLNDANVSRRHATIKKDWNGFVILDLGSKNGVLVNDKAITRPRRLKDRDEITIGPIKLLFVDPDADLLDALKGVPGFEVEELEPEPEPMEAGPSHAGAPQRDIEPPMGGEGPAAPRVVAPMEEEDDLANIDPSLLEPAESSGGFDWIIIGGVTLLLIASAGALYLMFA